MTRKTRKDKEIARLRREIEALRAQLKSESGPKDHHTRPLSEITSKPREERAIIDIRPDLKKTALLTAVSLGILTSLYLWLPL